METQTGTDIELAADFLKNGELVAIPTETVYGLAANALDPNAVLKIFKAKNRPHFNPLIVHLKDWNSVHIYAQEIPKEAISLALHFTPGPLTFLLKKRANIPDLVTAGSDKVALRIPSHPLTQRLLELLDFPFAAPSANPFGYVSPTTAEHVLEGLSGKIPYILDGGACQVGLESTIVDFEDGEVITRREGGISIEELERVINRKVVMKVEAEEHPVAPGQLKSHYATETPLFIGEFAELAGKFQGKKICLIAFGERRIPFEPWKQLQLSENANLDEAAKNLFSVMRHADQCGADLIITNWLPETGLGRAINDRLRRASVG